MSITILRKTSFIDSWRSLELLVDQHSVARLPNQNSQTFELPYYPAKLTVKEDPKSALIVNNHQILILETNPLYQCLTLAILGFLFLSFFHHTSFVHILFISITSILVISLFFIPQYRFRPFVSPNMHINNILS